MSKSNIIYLYLIFWFLINSLFLTTYPFTHSDEPWLSGLSRSMIAGESLKVTEDFFDLYGRNPHAIKVVFHITQIVFIKILGYSIFSVRFISLIAGFFTLLFLNKLIIKLYDSDKKELIALLTVIFLSINIQFVYISHLARQEIFMILITLLMFNITLNKNITDIKKGLFTGLLLGVSVGIHPNSFIIAWTIGLYIFVKILRSEKNIKEGLYFLLSAGIVTCLFIIISFTFNPNFVQDYITYGEPLGVLDTTDVKLLKLPNFYTKLFNGVSGTYHNPNIKMIIISFPLFVIFSFLRKKNSINLLVILGFFGFNIGLFIIGKYSQPSISLLLPFVFISASALIEGFILIKHKFIGIILIVFLFGFSIYFTIDDIQREKESYSLYLSELKPYIPDNSIVLSNLSNDYLLLNGQNYDWRNLHYLRDNSLTLQDYIYERRVEYIIVPEELSYIYKNRPYWNVIYGNLSSWYPELVDFTNESCSLIKEFDSPGYGMRITALRYTNPWKVKIYKVNYIESIKE